MKQLLIVAIGFLLSFSVNAQGKMDTSMHKKMGHDMKKDCVMMEDGKMMMMKDGKTMMMESDMMLKNGATVMTDGNMKMKDGKMMMLKDGDCVMMDGKMTHMPMKKKMSKSKM